MNKLQKYRDSFPVLTFFLCFIETFSGKKVFISLYITQVLNIGVYHFKKVLVTFQLERNDLHIYLKQFSFYTFQTIFHSQIQSHLYFVLLLVLMDELLVVFKAVFYFVLIIFLVLVF